MVDVIGQTIFIILTEDDFRCINCTLFVAYGLNDFLNCQLFFLYLNTCFVRYGLCWNFGFLFVSMVIGVSLFHCRLFTENFGVYEN